MYGLGPGAGGGGGTGVLVPPGVNDEYYGFFSGGPGGDVRVVGIPSMRLLRRIPVFESSAQYGYAMVGQDKEKMREGYIWGDVHHPFLSQTGGDNDGRWLFVNDKPNGRVARIDLRAFETDRILKLPNIQGAHGLAVHPDTRYVAASGEYWVPIPNGAEGARAAQGTYRSAISFIDPGSMTVKFQVLAPQTDVVDWAKDGTKLFATVYNIEKGLRPEEQIQTDQDAVGVVQLDKAEDAVAGKKYTVIGGVPVIDPEDVPGLLTLVPVPKNPHGVDVTPDGKYAIANGKLSPTVTIIDTKTLKVVAEPQIGLGPLHTTFDDKGNGYTSTFVDSQVVKWDIEKAVKGDKDYILDRIDVHYNPGHIQATGGDTVNPDGKWLVSLNKLSKGRFLSVGPDHPENNQLIDISGKKMKLVMDVPMDPEPHDAVFIKAEKLKDKVWDTFLPGHELSGENPVAEGQSRVERTGPNSVHVYMTAKRSEFGMPSFKVKQGDTVTLTVTNVERTRDITHGLALVDHNVNTVVPPGKTVTTTFKADKPGVFWYYCTIFCSALHLEMGGQMIVEPAS